MSKCFRCKGFGHFACQYPSKDPQRNLYVDIEEESQDDLEEEIHQPEMGASDEDCDDLDHRIASIHEHESEESENECDGTNQHLACLRMKEQEVADPNGILQIMVVRCALTERKGEDWCKTSNQVQ